MRRPLQVYVDREDLARLDAWAARRGWTKAEAIRVAIRALTRAADEDPLLGLSGMIQGLPPVASDRFDRYLEETFVAETSPRRGPRARRSRPRARR